MDIIAKNVFFLQSVISKAKLDARAFITRFQSILNFYRIELIFKKK